MPCNFNLRELAAEGQGRHPRGGRHADGVQHHRHPRRHHDGHRGDGGSLVSREVIADSIELVARGHMFDARGRPRRPATRRSPARRWRSRGSTCPASSSTAARSRRAVQGPRRHHPGRLRGRRRARAGQDDRRGAPRPRGPRLPRRRRLRRPVHRQHDGHGAGVPRPLADGHGERPGDATRARRGRRRGRPAGDGSACDAASAPSRHPHARGARERHRRRGRTGGSTNAVLHLLAIAREAGVAADDRRLRPRQRADADRRRPASRAGATSPPTWTARAGSALVAQRLVAAGLLHVDALTVTGRTIGEVAASAARDAGPGRGAAGRRPAEADRRPGDPQGEPRPRGLRRQGRRARAGAPSRAGPRLRPRGGRDGGGHAARRSRPATWS